MSSLTPHLAPGTIVGERYRIEGLLGEGGFGVVFRATQLNLDRPVALKVLLPEALGDEGLHRFRREAEIVQRVEHPNVVRLLDFGHAEDGTPFLVFELLQGRTLEETLMGGGPLPPARAARIAAQVLKALMEAHAQGVVHRDVKPANIFVCRFQGEPDFVKVLDFGIAKGGGGRALTQRGGVLGTPAYMAPEQVDGREAGFATDLYALGLTVEEMLTARPVFAGVSLVDIVREHLGPSPVPHAAAALASPLGPLIDRATQKAPERRYGSAAEMLAHLDAIVAQTMPGACASPAGGVTERAGVVTERAGAVPARAYAPTAQPAALPIHGPREAPAGPLVPPLPGRAEAKRKGGGPPWALAGAIGGGAALLAGALAAVLAFTSSPAEKSKPPASASASAPESPLTWLDTRFDGSLAEAQIDGDGIVDFVGFCADPTTMLCAVSGATFRPLWRRPLNADIGEGSLCRLAAVGRVVAMADALGVLHLHDAATGIEQGSVRLGGRVERMCAAAELPGKLWIRMRDNRTATVDVATRALGDAPRPASCLRGIYEQRCFGDGSPRYCPAESAVPMPSAAFASETYVEGPNAVALGSKKTDTTVPMMIGFTPQPVGNESPRASVPVRWQRPLAPGDGLGATGAANRLLLRAGRAVTTYDDVAHKVHLVAIDAVTGRTLWDVVTKQTPLDLDLSPSRLYVAHHGQLEILDAATGRVLGEVGHDPFSAPPR